MNFNKWTKEKPDYPCVFMTRAKIEGRFDYSIWRIEEVNGIEDNTYYLAWLEEDGDEWDDIADMNFDEYFIIEKSE